MDPASLKVTELKAELKKLGLPINGLKKDLVERLTEALAQQAQDAPEPETEVMGDGDESHTEAGDNDEASPAESGPVEEEQSALVEEGDRDDASMTMVDEDEKRASVEVKTPAEETNDDTTMDDVPAPEPIAALQTEIVEPTLAVEATVEKIEPQSNEEGKEPEPQASIEPPADLSQMPILDTETEADLSQRKKRSRTPSVNGDEVEAKKARIEEEVEAPVVTIEADVKGEEAQKEEDKAKGKDEDKMEITPAEGVQNRGRSRSRTPAKRGHSRSPSHSRSRPRYDSRSRSQSPSRSYPHSRSPARQRPSIVANTKDARFKSLFNTTEDITPLEPQTLHSDDISDSEDVVEPATHPATRALYIRDLVRPLQEPQLRAHLVSLASSRNLEPDPSVLKNIHLDAIKTHAFVLFDSIKSSARARNGIHGKRWPDEKNRKILFADFIPEDKLEKWINTEKAERNRRFIVSYQRSEDGSVDAVLDDFINLSQPVHTRNPSISAVPPPRQQTQQQGGGGGIKVMSLDDLFLSTMAKPKLYYKPVDSALAASRLAASFTGARTGDRSRSPPPVQVSAMRRDSRGSRGDTYHGAAFRGRGGRRGGDGGGGGRGDSWTGRDRDWDRGKWARDGGPRGGRGGGSGGYRGRERSYSRSRSPVGRR